MKKVQRLVEIFVGKGFLHRTAQVILSALHCKDRIFKIRVKAMSLSLEWLLVLILTWCVPGQPLLIELDHHLRCQDVISNHPQLPSWWGNSLRSDWFSPNNKKEPGSTWHWPAWPAPGLPHRFPSTWSRTSTLQMSLLPQWFFLPATEMVNGVARKILEATWRPLSKPLGLISSPGWAFLAAGSSFEFGPGRFLFSCSVQRVKTKTDAKHNRFWTCSFFCLSLSSKALISSGQSRFSRGSHVFSSGPKPFQER